MKKLFSFILMFIFSASLCFADEEAEVERFFNDYVEAANSYNTDYFKYYSDDAEITRVVEKPDGTQQAVKIPLSRYKSEAKKGVFIAKIRRYKNKYFNIKISRHGSNWKISALRQPSLSSYKIPAEFIIGKDSAGEWKIKEESMNTRVQRFLNEK